MSQPQKPDRRLKSAESLKQEAAASRETSRPADSVPMISGSFANLPVRFGRYQVEKLLGRGAMGAVYLARDTQLNRRVALKIPKVSASGSKRLLLRLETEAKAAAQLDHPNLCKVYDAGEVEGQCFIAMQYIEGETLKSRLESTEISTSEAVALILHLAEGLSEAHELGIVHRDLKPENIMLNRRGVPVIMDFGLAKFSNISNNATATQAGTILGSPAYMSPEQASGRNQEIDQRSDIYSLGVILFELLTGSLPFTGTSMVVMGQKSILEPQSPLNLNADLPPQLSGICHKMIAKSNTDRYQSLDEVISDLRDLDSFIPQPAGLQPYALDAQAYPLEAGAELLEFQSPLPRSVKRKRSVTSLKQVSRSILYAGIAAGLVLLLGIVLWFRDGQALVRVEVHSPDVVVTFQDKSIQLVDGAHEYQVRPGDHTLHIKSGNVEFETNALTLKKGSNPAVTVELVNSEIVAKWGDQVVARHKSPTTKIASTIPASLLNQQNLDDWTSTTGVWQVENGIIVGRPGESLTKTTFLISKRRFKDFELNAEVRLKDGIGNSGIHFRSWVPDAASFLVYGPQCVVDWTGAPFPPGSLRFEQNSEPISEKASKSVAETYRNAGFNRYHIRCVGKHVTIKVNDVVALDGDYPAIPDSGVIAWQIRGGNSTPREIAIRHLEIREFVTSDVNSPTANAPQQEGAPRSAVAPFRADEGFTHQQAWSNYLGVPVEYTNSVGMKFMLIPPGEFLMGSSPAEIATVLKTAGNDAGWREQARSEGPQHRVVLTKPFYLAVHEVTQKAYREVTGANPSHFAVTGAGKKAVAGIDTADYPVEMVSWTDAAKFCEKLSTREKLTPFYTARGASVVPFAGTGYRLPTEAEWEFSCRAGTTTNFSSGDTGVDLRKIAWIGKQPNKVGSMIKNSFGFYDLHGNVWEIVQDEWSSNYYASFQKVSAVDPCLMPSGNKNYVVRGGCWSNPVSCRSSARSPSGPPFRYNIIGFRVALAIEAVKLAIQNGTLNSRGS